MLTGMKTHPRIFNLSTLFLVMGLVILAIEPVRWLVISWFEQSYDSDGLWIFLLFTVLLLWSLSSPRQRTSRRHYRTALVLLTVTALIRLAGQLLAINVIGALALVVDVYALGLLLGLDRRRRPLSPLWLALLFACALPLERILQRTLGYALQQLSAWSSCSVLTAFEEGVVCNGTRIQLPSETLLIDLPCSGASALVLLSVLLTTLMAIARPNWMQSVPALLSVLLAAWMSNSLRILMLATGVMHPIPGIDVMRQPWHELVGLMALLPGLAVLIWLFRKVNSTHVIWAKRKETRANRCFMSPGFAPLNPGYDYKSPVWPSSLIPASLTFLLLALVIVTRTPQPLDAGRVLDKPYAPRFLAGEFGNVVPLLTKERTYFEQFGGAATKIQYEKRGLLITHTESPLRHLHAPDECLRGLGFEVDYQGSHAAVLPTAVYRAVSPDGAAWKVSVSFIAADGGTASNVAEAVWQWFQAPQPWVSVQRIAPWGGSAAADDEWDRLLFAALDYPAHPDPPPQPSPPRVEGDQVLTAHLSP